LVFFWPTSVEVSLKLRGALFRTKLWVKFSASGRVEPGSHPPGTPTDKHGQEKACEIYVLLNLLAFQMHGILLLLDEGRQKARASIRRLDEFFGGLRLIFSRFLFQTWEEFIGFIVHDDEPGG
jgi:hypothetical protein